jgi:amidohydrolase
MKRFSKFLFATAFLFPLSCLHAAESDLQSSIAKDYQSNLANIFDQFHRNPELSLMEVKTAAKLAQELRDAGFQVTEGVGKTGLVAILKNGPGPLVMMRSDMDGLPVEEKSGLPNASKVRMKDPNGIDVPVAHACGHDVHMTSLIGTAHQMAARRNQWSGTLMLIGQPAEERVLGAKDMMQDNLWKRFGKPDYALALHVIAGLEAGKIVVEEAPWSGVDTLQIIVHGVGSHGAAPSIGKDPIVLGAQIVLALQEIISRERNPYEPAVITVGAFHAGTKANIIGDVATLDVTVRSEDADTRKMLLKSITRVTLNTARAYGIEEAMLPEIKTMDIPAQPTLNDAVLRQRLISLWTEKLGSSIFSTSYRKEGMGAEDFNNFTSDPYIPSVYYKVGGTLLADLIEAKKNGRRIPGNHSPLFKVDSEVAIKTSVQTTVIALMELLKK